MVVPFLGNMLAQAGSGWLMSNLFGGGGGRPNTEEILSQYQQDVSQRPDYSYLQQDPLIQNIQRQGNMAQGVGRQQAMQELMRSGFGRSNIGAVSGARAGAVAQQPYIGAQASMLSGLQQDAENKRIQALRDVLSSRLGTAGRREQVDYGLMGGLVKAGQEGLGGLFSNMDLSFLSPQQQNSYPTMSTSSPQQYTNNIMGNDQFGLPQSVMYQNNPLSNITTRKKSSTERDIQNRNNVGRPFAGNPYATRGY